MSHARSAQAKTVRLRTTLDKSLKAYAIAASSAGVALLAIAPPAEAKIIFTPAHKKIGMHTLIDLNHDGISDFQLSLIRTSHCEGGCTTTGGIRHGTAFTVTNATLRAYGVAKGNQLYGQGKFAWALPAHVSVGPNGRFPGGNLMAHVNAISGSNEYYSGKWAGKGAGVQHRFLGLKFKIHGKVHFGWARLNVTISPGATIIATLVGYAYETIPNKPIVTGRKMGPDAGLTASTRSLPTLGSLARGCTELAAWRKQHPDA